jgi:membrane-associated phospholipid phosphatase
LALQREAADWFPLSTRPSFAFWRDVGLQSPFDPRSGPIYLLIAAMAGVGLVLCWLLHFKISLEIFENFYGMPLMSVLAGMCLRRIGKPNFGGAIEVLGLFFIQGLSAFFLIAPLAAISMPLADASLARADQFIGFDWATYLRVTAPLNPVLLFAYRSFAWQTVIVATLYLFGQSDRVWTALLAAIVALAITAVIFPFVPAEGASLFFGIDVQSPLQPFAPALLALKYGHRVLEHSTFKGLISFPSYHTAAAVIFTWACWRSRIRWPVLLLNLLLIAAAIPFGSHYLVDLLAGGVVGAASVAASVKWFENPWRTFRGQQSDA